jgi:hypothetical protein
MAAKGRTIIAALDEIRDAIILNSSSGGIGLPQLANGPEKVLGFNVRTTITLIPAAPPIPSYFSTQGEIANLNGKVLKGSRAEASLPTDPAGLPQVFKWPNPQTGPFAKIPPDVDSTSVTNSASTPRNRNTPGYSKQEYFFGDEDGSSLVTVGPSLAKVTLLKDGGAEFCSAGIGAISQGTGKYLGAKGMGTFNGSAFFETWPKKPADVLALLEKGFKAQVATYFKVVLKQDQ